MLINSISPVIHGNFKYTSAKKATSNVPSQTYATNELMSAKAANALKSQVSFSRNPITHVPGVEEDEVEGVKKYGANIFTPGEPKTDKFGYNGFELKTEIDKPNNRRISTISYFDKAGKVRKGIISLDMDFEKDKNPYIKSIDFNRAKFQPEIKITLADNSTIQLFEGSKFKTKDGKVKVSMTGDYDNISGKGNPSKKIISFTGTVVSTLCNKDATAEATNNAKNEIVPTMPGKYTDKIDKDTTFVVLGGGFGTRFKNMTQEGQNKPSFVMPSGSSILGGAVDLIKNSLNTGDIGNILYLEQADKEHGIISDNVISPQDSKYTTESYKSDGGAVIKSIIDGKIRTDKPLVILNADTITNIDVSQTLYNMESKGNAALTIPYYPVNETRAKEFGLMDIADGNQITGFKEKPKDPNADAPKAKIPNSENFYGNPGIYVFSKEVLQDLAKGNDSLILNRAKQKKGITDELNVENAKQLGSITGLGANLVPSIVELTVEGKLKDENGQSLVCYTDDMKTTEGKQAYWDDIGSAEAFVHTCQKIASNPDDFKGVRGIDDFIDSVDKNTSVVYASPEDKKNYIAKGYNKQFEVCGDAYIVCKG